MLGKSATWCPSSPSKPPRLTFLQPLGNISFMKLTSYKCRCKTEDLIPKSEDFCNRHTSKHGASGTLQPIAILSPHPQGPMRHNWKPRSRKGDACKGDAGNVCGPISSESSSMFGPKRHRWKRRSNTSSGRLVFSPSKKGPGSEKFQPWIQPGKELVPPVPEESPRWAPESPCKLEFQPWQQPAKHLV
jgi:hypothetical protein